MRILVLGAGATGGYFGGRMAAAGSDLTFLVREKRAAQLRNGLRIESPHGDATVPVMTITAGSTADPFDVIILSCKSYGLAGALESIAAHVRPGLPILPLLNGFAHVETIERRFPEAVVWGGTAGIIATLAEDGTVRQMHPNQFISAGPRGERTDGSGLLEPLVSEMCRAGIVATLSDDIEREMWDKWCFLATLAAATCLLRAPIGEILATDHGEAFIRSLYDECNQTAAAEGLPPGPPPVVDYPGMLFDRNGNYTASMLRDMESGGPTEAQHVIGDLIRRAEAHGIGTPNLGVAYGRLQIYEARRSS